MYTRNLWLAAVILLAPLLSFCGAPRPHATPTPVPSHTPLPSSTSSPAPSPTPLPTPTVQLPSGAAYGDCCVVTFELASGKPEADPDDNTLTVELAIARNHYLPIIRN